MIKPRETFNFNPPIQIKGDWMIGLKGLEIYLSTFIINTTNNKFGMYTDSFDKFSFQGSKEELEEMLSISDTTPYHLQH